MGNSRKHERAGSVSDRRKTPPVADAPGSFVLAGACLSRGGVQSLYGFRRLRVALSRRLAKPFERFGEVLLDATAILVAQAEVTLADRVALLGRQTIPFGR